jgi:hypothetical protein
MNESSGVTHCITREQVEKKRQRLDELSEYCGFAGFAWAEQQDLVFLELDRPKRFGAGCELLCAGLPRRHGFGGCTCSAEQGKA